MNAKQNEKQNEWLTKLFGRLQWLNEQRHLYSIRTAFISTMPIMIIGAYAVIINQMPIPAYQSFMEGVFGERWRMFGGLAYNGTTQIVTLMVVFAVCANLAQWYNTHQRKQVHSGICGMVGLACYAIVSIPVQDAAFLPFGMTGVTGLFVAMLVSVVTGEVFIHLSSRKSAVRLLSDDPNLAVPQSFASILPAVVVVGFFALLRVVLVRLGVEATFGELVAALLASPYQTNSNSIGTGMLFNLSTHVMWLFGIHGNNVLDGVAQSIFVPAMQANVEAVALGQAAPNLITKTLFDAFVYMGGSGTTLAMLLAMMIFGKTRSNRTLMRYAWPNTIFNINEPIIFGIPVVLNPIYAIPFVLTPVVMFTTTALSMLLGLVPYTTVEVSWATPVFVSGYLSTGSFAGVALQAVNLVLAVAIYAPFVKLSEKMDAMRFERAYKKLSDTVTSEYSASSRRLINRVDEVGAVARQLANQLDDALAKNQMFLVYQPIVNAKEGELDSVEALLRWKHPQHGFINPMVIIALAEETGRVDRLGLWVMDQAMQQRKAWTEEGMPDFHIAVNVSTKQLNVPSFHDHVQGILRRYGVPPHQLQVEITETVALAENDATQKNLMALHDLGASIAMDDFGVGHSSLLYLRTMPINTLKIDGSLSREVVNHPANLEIIATIHDLCKLLNVGTIVEYVDNQKQLELLLGVGAFLVQGYLFSPPLAGDAIPAFASQVRQEAEKMKLLQAGGQLQAGTAAKPPLPGK